MTVVSLHHSPPLLLSLSLPFAMETFMTDLLFFFLVFPFLGRVNTSATLGGASYLSVSQLSSHQPSLPTAHTRTLPDSPKSLSHFPSGGGFELCVPCLGGWWWWRLLPASVSLCTHAPCLPLCISHAYPCDSSHLCWGWEEHFGQAFWVETGVLSNTCCSLGTCRGTQQNLHLPVYALPACLPPCMSM